jgi:hypothetical protein
MRELQRHTLLSAQDCALWTQQVLADAPHWTRRHPSVPFHTLGMAAYLDCKSAPPQSPSAALYRQRILRDASNAQLMARFAPLYQKLCEGIGQIEGVTAHLIPQEAALPGFHIHLPHPAFAGDVASIHRDLQFQQVFADQTLRPEQVFTFTLPLSMPPESGLYLWEGEDKVFYPYTLGELVIHSGLLTHQAVLRCAGSAPPRIALQGHGVRWTNSVALYW